MSIEQNKKLARDFFDRFSANDIAGALDMMTHDATWWIAGKSDSLPAAGNKSWAFGDDHLSHFPRDRHHRLSRERRHDRTSAADRSAHHTVPPVGPYTAANR